MDNFDLDRLKKTWQQQKVDVVYNEQQIEAMLGKSSRNYVKYILWISIAEFVLICLLNIFYVFKSEESSSFMNILTKIGLEKTTKLEADFQHLYFFMKILSLLITGVFVYLFYKNYRKINVEANLKKFILQIIRFKRTVNIFILANIFILIGFTAVLSIFVFVEISDQQLQVASSTLTGILAGLGFGLVLAILLVLLYYRVVYGIIMRKLGKNLLQLQKTENEN